MQMNMTTVNQILNDFGTHNWVKDQYKAAERRDIVDSINDAEILVAMLKARFSAITSGKVA